MTAHQQQLITQISTCSIAHVQHHSRALMVPWALALQDLAQTGPAQKPYLARPWLP